MAEETIFVGPDTAAAELIRNARVIKGLQATPLKWFATVLAGVLGRRVDHTPAKLRDTVPFARGVLAGLGFDPDTHELSRRRGSKPGLVVRAANGRPVRFVSETQLRKLQNDEEFLNAFASETKSA